MAVESRRYVSNPLRRSAAYALLTTVSLIGARSIWVTAGAFLAVAAGAAILHEGPMFQLFSTPADRREGHLRTLVSLSLAAAGIASLVEILGLPVSVFVATLLTLGFGDFGTRLARVARTDDIWATIGFVFIGGSAAFLGQVVVSILRSSIDFGLFPEYLFLSTSAALLGALLRSVFFDRNDPLVLGLIVLLLWLFAELTVSVGWTRILIALFITFVLGYLSFVLDTASIQGMLTGVFLSLLALVLGGYGWFAILMAFFVVGGLGTKYRYEEKQERGIAEANEGARGTENVLGNSLPALAALLLFAAHGRVPIESHVFVFAFAGSVATALADTLSSEIGGLYDHPRLITTFERVTPGTDGAVTWQGELAGLLGATLVAALAVLLLSVDLFGASVIVVAGLVGMTADSLAGALIEGEVVGNQSVNIIATSVGAVVGAILSAVLF
ncbi:MAG: DUF92 domain-containing protein [Halodesulfurarchaeum sp.]